MKRVVFLSIFVILSVALMSNVALGKFVCDEKTKGIGGGATKYYECEGGATIKEVFGTEYVQGQTATMFIQVLDNNNQPFNSSLLCQLEIWSPNKTKIFDVGMVLLSGSNNTIFYRDFNPVPNSSGVYIASATCSTPTSANKTREFLKQNATFPDYLEKGTGSSPATISYTLTAGNTDFICQPPTFFQEEGNYDKYFYIEQINSTTYWDKTGVPAVFVDLRMRVYKQNINTLETELVFINTVFNISLTNVIKEVNFTSLPMIFLDPNTERIAIDYCARTVVAGGSLTANLRYNGNTATTNSSILKTTFEKNISIGYQELRGSGEFHVNALSELNPPFLSTTETNAIWIIIFVIFIAIFITAIWWMT